MCTTIEGLSLLTTYLPSKHSLGYGKNDKVTFTGNYIHHISGRSPKLEFNSYWHVYNNFWFNNTGHALDVGKGTNALIEGNVFQQVKIPFLDDSSAGKTFAVTTSDKSSCDSKLGRTCAVNTLTSSGTLSASDESVLSSWPSGESGIDVQDAARVKSSVLSDAGVGKLGRSSSPNFKRARQSGGATPWGRSLSSAGPGATPCSNPSVTAPKWTWKTIGVKPTTQPRGSSPHEESHSADKSGFPLASSRLLPDGVWEE